MGYKLSPEQSGGVREESLSGARTWGRVHIRYFLQVTWGRVHIRYLLQVNLGGYLLGVFRENSSEAPTNCIMLTRMTLALIFF